MSTVFFIFSKNFFLLLFLVYNAPFFFLPFISLLPAVFPLFYLFIIAIVFSARCVLSWCFSCSLQRVYNSCVSSFRLQCFRQSFRLYCFRGSCCGSVRNAGSKARKICFSSGPCCRICFSSFARCASFRASGPFRCFSRAPVVRVLYWVYKAGSFPRPSRGPRPVCSFNDISNGRKRQLTISTQCNSNNGNSNRQPEDLPILFFTAWKKDLLPVQ